MAKGQARKTKKYDVTEEFVLEVHTNQRAIQDGPKRKKFTKHDLRHIRPMNETQRMFFESYLLGNNIVGSGSAGTGKSFCGLYLALNDVLSEDSPRDKIVIVRSAVQSRSIGFTPGDVNEKMEPYESPYVDICADLLGKSKAYETAKDTGLIQFMPTSFLRGNSWDNCVILIDEIQSCNLHEIMTIMTRTGNNSRVIALGDMVQDDLIYHKNDSSGMGVFLEIANRMPEFDVINFTKDDIVRSKFVKSFITTYESVVKKYS